MPEEVRRAFLLRKQSQLSHRDVAAEMGLTVERVSELLIESVVHLAPPGALPPNMSPRMPGSGDELLARVAPAGADGSAATPESQCDRGRTPEGCFARR